MAKYLIRIRFSHPSGSGIGNGEREFTVEADSEADAWTRGERVALDNHDRVEWVKVIGMAPDDDDRPEEHVR